MKKIGGSYDVRCTKPKHFILEMSEFCSSDTATSSKLSQIFFIGSTCDNMTLGQVL